MRRIEALKSIKKEFKAEEVSKEGAVKSMKQAFKLEEVSRELA